MTFMVLMWKHMKARYRHYSKTILELLFPILILCLAYIIKDLIYNVQVKSKAKWIHRSTMYMDSPKQVLYYPPTVVTNKIMDLVGEKLNFSRLRYFPDHHTSGFYGIQNISTVKDILDTIDKKTAIVTFEGFNNLNFLTYPDKLNYTIRMQNKLKRNKNIFERKIFTDLSSGPMPEKIVSLQWAIDNSYLYLKYGLNHFQDISIEPLVKRESILSKIYVVSMMHIFCFLSLGVVFLIHCSRVMDERVSGTQALLAIAGVSPATYNISHFLNAMLFSGIYTAGVVGILLLSVSSPPMVQYSDLSLVALMIFMYYINTIALGFFTCYLLSETRHVMTSAAAFYGLSFMPSLFLYKVQFVHDYLEVLFGFIPHVPMDWFWGHLANLEANGSGLNQLTLFQTNSSDLLKPYVAYVMMFVQFIVLSLLTYYFALVSPGKFSSPLPWDFMFDKAFWSGGKLHCDVELIADLHGPSDKYRQYFQQRPVRKHIGIRIVNVSKIYGVTPALQKITVSIQRGEIFLLLGHNGAGKTTLLNIVCGMEQATTGKVYVNGLEVSTYTSRVKRCIGVCPQQNILIPELTIIEHIMFFTMLRQNVSFRKARADSEVILKQLGLQTIGGSRIYNITPNDKRRLQLGCAIAGKTDVLILDEPTTGLDVATRRRMWDLLLSLKNKRTVLLTTHFMEEADALGDRVAALHVGRLRCDATPLYLKSVVGKGYRLTLTTIGTPKIPLITEKVFAQVPEASFIEGTVNSLTFSLPTNTRDKFTNLFEALEQSRDVLCIQAIGIGTVTLEEVFLSLCSDVHVSFRQVHGGIEGRIFPKAKGIALYLRQLMALWERQIQYYIAYKYSSLLLEFIIPVFMLTFLTYTTNALKSDRPNIQFSGLQDLTAYNDISNKKVLLHLDKMTLRQLRPKFEDAYNRIQFEYVPDLNRRALQLNNEYSPDRGNILFGIDVNKTNAKILYSATVRNSASVALNLLANILAERSLPNYDLPVITTYIEPITTKDNNTHQFDHDKIKSVSDIFNWALYVSLVIIATVVHCVTSLSREQLAGTRRIYIMYGCSPILYWLFTWLFHTLFYIVILVVPALIVTTIFEGDETLDLAEFRVALCTTLIIGLMAYLALLYLISLYSSEKIVVITGSILILVFGMATPICHSIIRENPTCCGFLLYIMHLMDYTIPPHTFTTNLLIAGEVARVNALCKIIRRVCPNVNSEAIAKLDVTFDIKHCCETTGDIQCYFCLDGLGDRFIIGAVQSIVYMTLVILSQIGWFNGLWDKLINRKYKPTAISTNDPFILSEINHVNNAIRLPPESCNDVLLVQNLHKRFRTLCHSSVAVSGVTFSVKKGECFGIVGLPGAGKTTIMRMLAGSECITRGKVVCNGIRARSGGSNIVSTKYLRTLGYCTQYHHLDDFRTGEDNLATLLKLRGYNKQDVKNGVDSWINIVALAKQGGKRVWAYSGGCKRRLAAAAAMMTGGALTLLDDPIAGIDVSARREVWLALSEGLKGERAALVTSATMGDLEALCNRVCILVDGKIKALATPAELRARHEKRYLLQIYLNTDASTTPESLQQIDIEIKDTFKCKLIDSHRSMLQYRISRTQTYSEIFKEAESLKDRYKGIILDYTVKEPMLEDVFLEIVKQSKLTESKLKANEHLDFVKKDHL